LFLTAGLGLDVPLKDSFAIRGQAGYRKADIKKINETPRSYFSGFSLDGSPTHFDYTGFFVRVGAWVDFSFFLGS